MDARRIRETVGPLAKERFDQRLGLAVGLRTTRSRVAPLDPELDTGIAPGKGAIAVAVVGEDALDDDTSLCVPTDGPAQEGDAVGRALAREQLRVGEARVVVDCQVQVLPAGVTTAVADVGAEDTLADRPEAAQALDVDVHELARPLPLVADDRATTGSPQAGDAVAAKHLPHGRGG